MSITRSTGWLGYWRRGLAPVLVVGFAAIAGCSTYQEEDLTASISDDYRARHPIIVGEKLQVMDVPVGNHTARVSTRMRGNIVGFAQRFRESNSSALAVVLPQGSGNQAAARQMATEVEAALVTAGVSPRAIERRTYQADPQEDQAPVRLAYVALGAESPPCGEWPDQLADSTGNRNYYNYGCATQQNLAAMVADPLDLLYPRATSPADAERRGTVLEHYRNGEVYQSDYSRVTGGEVAQGVGQ